MKKEIGLDLKKAKKIMLKIVKKGGKIAKKGFENKDKIINYKDSSKKDIVTEYDIIIEKLLVSIIKKNFPGHSILAEEISTKDNNSDYTWIIDPIDGTRNYARGIPIFMISLALAKKNDVIMCASYNPIIDELYFAQKNQGAYLNNKQIFVSKNNLEDSDIIITTGGNKSFKKKLFYILLDTISIRNYYSIVFSTALVSSGKVDALVSAKAHPWDYSNYLLIQEAGGKVTDFEGEKFDITKNTILMSNGKIHKELIKKLKDLK